HWRPPAVDQRGHELQGPGPPCRPGHLRGDRRQPLPGRAHRTVPAGGARFDRGRVGLTRWRAVRLVGARAAARRGRRCGTSGHARWWPAPICPEACPPCSGVGSKQRGRRIPKGSRILLCRRVELGAVMSFLKWAGQAAMGVPFIWLGYEAFSEPGGRVALAENFGIPQPETVVKANGLAMVAGGTALVTNVLPRAAAV